MVTRIQSKLVTPIVGEDNLPSSEGAQNCLLDPFVDVSYHVVAQHLGDKGLDDATLDNIQKYLAAHFWAITVERGALIKDTTGEASQTYSDYYLKREGLTTTRFGQTALALDTTGTLAGLSKKTTKQSAILQIV